VALPIYGELTEAQQRRVVEAIGAYYARSPRAGEPHVSQGRAQRPGV
jgi:hypothetical protein